MIKLRHTASDYSVETEEGHRFTIQTSYDSEYALWTASASLTSFDKPTEMGALKDLVAVLKMMLEGLENGVQFAVDEVKKP